MKSAFRALLLCAVAIPFVAPATLEAQEPAPIESGLRAGPDRYLDGVDALHYDIELAISDRAQWIWGTTGIRLVAEEDGITQVRLDFTGMEVLNATASVAGAAPVRVTTTAQAGILTVPFGSPARTGDQIQLQIEYRGTPDDGLLLQETVEGRRAAFVDNWPNRTRFWVPTIDHPSDKATVRFTVHAPARWEVIANGRLIGQPISSGTPPATWPPADEFRTWNYSSDVPHPTYTMVIGATEMVIQDLGLAACGLAPASPRPDGCVEVSQWLYPGSVESGSPNFRRATEMLDFFADIVGPFPYEKLAHVQSSTRFGGMENSSAIFYSEQGLASGRDMEGTVSHETAHQWFGDSVTEGDWGHLWLSEGFATYFGALFFLYAEGPEDFASRIEGTAQTYLNSADTLSPAVDMSTPNLFDMLNRNSYQKGGMVLHMLRGQVGDDIFFAGIRDYYETYRDSTALTSDLQRVMEEASGQDLEWFFNQWLFEPGYPVLRAEQSAGAAGGLQLNLHQVQGNYAPRFRLPLTIEFRFNGTSVREEVLMDGASASWFFSEVPGDAEVVVDPDGWILKRVVR